MSELIALTGTVVGTYLWRALGVSFSGRINTDSEVFVWVTCVTYAMVAGLVFRIMLLPVGMLAEWAPGIRLLASAAGIVVMIWPHKRLGGLVP
ncbi:MAG: hypothetical protein RL043_1361, partial [Pseudomonadota bacterium]